MVFWPSGFCRGLGHQGPNTTHVAETKGLLKMSGFLALLPQASTKTLGPKTTSGSLGVSRGERGGLYGAELDRKILSKALAKSLRRRASGSLINS